MSTDRKNRGNITFDGVLKKGHAASAVCARTYAAPMKYESLTLVVQYGSIEQNETEQNELTTYQYTLI